MAGSPLHYNEMEDAFITDADFKVNINKKMQVPSKISFNHEQQNGVAHNNWSENINMQVPERILVAGQDQHLGTRAPPREIVFDHSIFPTEPYPGDVRVATPPRTLTLDKCVFPSFNEHEEEPVVDKLPVIKKTKFNLNDIETSMAVDLNSSTLGPNGDTLTVSEEVLHLRRQMSKLNRRIMALELDNLNRIQRETFIYGIGIAYFLLKAIFWMNKS